MYLYMCTYAVQALKHPGEDAMYYNNSSQTRTFKIVEENHFSNDDVTWIRSLKDVSLITVQKKSIRVLTETDEAIKGIIDAINRRFCNSSKPKLHPLF
jgi:hypothetical protein